MRLSQKVLFAIPLVSMGLFAGCKKSGTEGSLSETETEVDFRTMKVADNFDYSTTNVQSISASVKLLGGEPYEGAKFEVYLEDPGAALDNDSLYNALTPVSSFKLNAKGQYNSEIKLPAYAEKIYVLSKSVGIPAYFELAKTSAGFVLNYDAAVETLKAQTVSTTRTKFGSSTLATRGWNHVGFPDYLTAPEYVSSNFLRRFQAAVPYKTPVNPAYLNTDIPRDIHLNLQANQTANVSITFMFATSWNNNTLGYYWYPTNNPPASKTAIVNKGYIFPSTSRSTIPNYSGLVAGQTVKLVGPNADGSFPPNTSIGFYLISAGFSPKTPGTPGAINTTKTTYFSNKEFNNVGSLNMAGQKQRLVTLYDQATNKIVWSFEDGTDADFSDVAFFASWTPDEAIDKTKYPPLPTVPKTDADYVFYPGKNVKGTLLFEDCWPRLADFDMNDIVMNYNYVGAKDEEGKVSEVNFKYNLVSISAQQNNSFGVMIPDVLASNVKSISNLDLNGVNVNSSTSRIFTIESGHTNDVVVKVFEDASTLMGGGVVNNTGATAITRSIENFSFTIKFNQAISVSAFNKIAPFIIPRGARNVETHLANNRPTSKANTAFFGTEDDNTSVGANRYYLSNTRNSGGNLVWAVDVPMQIPYPKSGQAITRGYRNFADWATSGGVNKKDWYTGGTTNRSAGWLVYPSN